MDTPAQTAGVFYCKSEIMKKIEVTTHAKKMLADVYTPVGMYMRLRDRFRDTVLLESADSHAGVNSYSIIGVNAIAGFEVMDSSQIEFKFPARDAERQALSGKPDLADRIWDFMQKFSFNTVAAPVNISQSLFGYMTHESVQFFDTIRFTNGDASGTPLIPLLRYRFYQYVIIVNHFKNELFICENETSGIESQLASVESAIRGRDVPRYPFDLKGGEQSDITDAEYLKMVDAGIRHCGRGDVFQIVLSRGYQQAFTGDEFNVYRALRNINPSPYMFYFDYGDYRLFGSSPESQIVVQNGTAKIHPIAGTFRRTGIDEEDQQLAVQLRHDKKELAEHTMLVDLARNDLGILCGNVEVSTFCEVQFFSHVIHLVSEVKARVKPGVNPVKLITTTFPAGTLSGAPKYRALELIDKYEHNSRSYYGGCIGQIGFDGSINHAIIIRTFLSMNNKLHYRAGAGVTFLSKPENELKEVHNKLNALTQALQQAQTTKNENIII